MSEFTDLLRRIAQRYATQQAFARALGISVARLNRAMNQADYPLNVANCLRLAELADEDPSAVLRVAGKADVADLITRLYGTPLMVSDLATAQRNLLKIWDRVPVAVREHFLVLLTYAAEAAAPAPRRAKPTAPSTAGAVTRRSRRRSKGPRSE